MRRWILFVLLSLPLAACSPLGIDLEHTPTPAPVTFRSDQFHLQVTLPPGWAAAEGPKYLARPFFGLVAFNSWGESDFWAPWVRKGTTTTYSHESTLGQVPEKEAYVVLINSGGGIPPPPESYGPEYKQEDLGGLWKQEDCREGRGVTWDNFCKWGKHLRLEVYCRPNGSDETAAAVNGLLASWRFDQVPIGNVGWAAVEARQLLPAVTEPAQFPLPAGPRGGPFEALSGGEGVIRMTQAEIQQEIVVVTFMYRWNVPSLGAMPDDCPADCCHWWKVEARPNGEIVVTEEGGAALPVGGTR